jgi:UDP-3-O-[3-hydroxymyristoyl] glucosamine N-acyltransferase
MGGDSEVGKDYVVGGGAVIDQNVKIGDFSILRSNSVTALDIPQDTIGI